ncbi:cob(I)yrinic acid a,c-diamide adenosyltransferase [Candidatus Dojkabacteria bacterium]|nr:cob(I)yrinic acid a,c-diamide adenosyltransferase [Candidatus Dojkabacteria bacterium]
MKIYTKKGDQGKTSALSGENVFKDNPLIEASGAIDELNSILGLALCFIEKNSIKEKIEREQTNLYILGADISSDIKDSNEKRLKPEDINKLETEIDIWDTKLPKLTSFIRPNGNKSSSIIHYARSVCRRTERRVITLSKSREINKLSYKYLNRLSDWLFIIARILNN